jgi:hypothetical protein
MNTTYVQTYLECFNGFRDFRTALKKDVAIFCQLDYWFREFVYDIIFALFQLIYFKFVAILKIRLHDIRHPLYIQSLYIMYYLYQIVFVRRYFIFSLCELLSGSENSAYLFRTHFT